MHMNISHDNILMYMNICSQGFEAEFQNNGGRLRYVKTVDAGRKLIASGCSSYLMSHVVSLLRMPRTYTWHMNTSRTS